MDVEAIQLLNLSPIPELSELELSTVMDQLSGLSDINGDLTDQHVEDILKEAEDLIDKSESNKIIRSDMIKITEMEGKKSLEVNQEAEEVKSNSECGLQELPNDDIKHYNTPVNSDHLINDECDEDNANKYLSSSRERTPVKIFSPGGSCNHIKSTIDSLKEFSSMIEMQLTNRSPRLSPKFSKILKDTDRSTQTKEAAILDNLMSEKSSHSRIVQTPDSIKMSNSREPIDKSVKLLNCFERLYQNKPVRLSTNKKTKVTEKVPKIFPRKKLTKDLKSSLRNSKQGKTVKKYAGEEMINTVTENIYQNMSYALPKSCRMDLLHHNKTPCEYPSFSNSKYLPDLRSVDSKTANNLSAQSPRNHSLGSDKLNSGSNLNLSKIDEKLILKVLEEVEQIKDHVKRAGVLGDGQGPEKAAAEDQGGVIDSLKSEMESVREKVTSVSNAGIKRLQEQFSILKLKYYHQMDKLEAENIKLREALHKQEKFIASRRSANNILSPASEPCFMPERKNYKISLPSSPSSSDTDKKATQTDCRMPSMENLPGSTILKEESCQTEKEVNNVSIQCTPDVSVDEKKEMAAETKKAENKENITVKHKLTRSKPFSDVGIHQLMRQKKLLDHESQLLATLRGLQAELTVKDKENRKLKTGMESLKKQIKKLANNKVDICRKSHTGTQTIGLGPCVQKTYTPETYEVSTSKEFERENEDLRLRIRALEEDFELLKAKRINDLQSLHQVHEEEMRKLVSKLETQSSLTRHLHSLLVNR